MAPLARMWKLHDGTQCIVSNANRAWRVDVFLGEACLRTETFNTAKRAFDAVQKWRREYTRASAVRVTSCRPFAAEHRRVS